MYRTAGAPHRGARRAGPADAAPSPGARAGRALAFVRGPRSPVAAYVSPRRPSLPRRPRPRGRACGLRPPAARVLMRACRVAGLRPRSGSRTARRGRTRVTYRATGRYRAPPGPGKGRGARRRRPHGGRLLAVSSSRRLYVAVHDHVEYARTECGDAPRRYRGILRVTAGYELRPASATRTSGSASNIHIDPFPPGPRAARAAAHTARHSRARTGGPSAIHAEPRATRYPS